MKRIIVTRIAFLLVLLAMVSVVGCTEVREVPSHDPEIIVFQTGAVAIVQNIVFALMGFGMAVWGIWLFRNWAKKSYKLKVLSELWLPLVIFLLAAFGFFYSAYVVPRLERVTIDQSSAAITIEKHYLLREETHQLAFTDISFIKYEFDVVTGENPIGTVMLVTHDGGQVKVSVGEPKSRYNLAQKISDATHKRLIQTEKR